MKRSSCLVRLRPSISLGRRRGYSKVSARWVACPLWDFQIVASQGMGAPSISSQEAQVRTLLAPLDSSRLSTKGVLLSLAFFGCFASFGGITSPYSTSCTFLFLFKSGLGSSPTTVTGRWEGVRLRGTWVLGKSLKVDSLFMLASRPFRLVLCFKSMLHSSSSELVSTRVTINLGVWAVEKLSKLASESKSSTDLSDTSPLSSRWN